MIKKALIAAASCFALAFCLMGCLSQGTQAQQAPEQTLLSVTSEESGFAEDVVMALAGSKDTYVLRGEEYIEAGCHATDKSAPTLAEGDITDTVVIEGNVDTSRPGDYTITYTATTDAGLKAQAERTVHVVDSFESNATTIPVLMYHYVYKESEPPEQEDANYLSDTKLREQLQYLNDNGYYYPSFQELRAFVDGKHTLPAKSVILTFDDFEWGFAAYGIPILNEYKVPATSFVICIDDNASERVFDNTTEYVRFESHSYGMHTAGSNVGRGGLIHALDRSEIAEDLRKSQELLGSNVAFAYPFGDNNESAWAAADDTGILCAFTIVNDRIAPGDNPMALNRVRISGGYSLDSYASLVAPE